MDSEFYAYGYDNGKRSHVWYSVFPYKRQKITPLDRLKNMLVGKGYSLIHIYRSPYPAPQPVWVYKTSTGWQEYGSMQEGKVSFKLWVAAMSGKKEMNQIRLLSSGNIGNASLEAYNIINKEFSNNNSYRFALLYANKNGKSLKVMHYSIEYNKIVQTKQKDWNRIENQIALP